MYTQIFNSTRMDLDKQMFADMNFTEFCNYMSLLTNGKLSVKEWKMWQDANFCLAAVQQNGYYLELVKPELQTEAYVWQQFNKTDWLLNM